MTHKVFISKGSAATPEQRGFVDAILNTLDTIGLSPRIMSENEWSFEQPLKAIKKIIKECDGAVIIAFTRTKFEKGIEIKKDKENEIKNILLPTTRSFTIGHVWKIGAAIITLLIAIATISYKIGGGKFPWDK